MQRASFYDRHGRDNGSDQTEEVPHSRLFILCGKDVTEEDLRKGFSPFGNIVKIKCVEDRNTGEKKGVAYITFSKTSEAAKAVEEMNGEFLPNHSKPLKVLIAANREQGAAKKDDPETYVRLFVVVPKTAEERTLREYFKQFGEIDLVHVVKSKETNENKGVAYVKYFKMSHAARAYEECDRSYKAVFARPRDGSKKHTDNPYLDRSYGGQGFDPSSVQVGPGDVINNYPNPEGFTKLAVTCCINLTSDQLYGLFGIVPGLEQIVPIPDPRVGYRGGQKVLVHYSSPQAAAYARDKFHGFGFPPNTPMVVVPDFSFGNIGGPGGAKNHLLSADSKNTLQTLTKALAQATSLLRSAGLSTDGLELGGNDSMSGDDSSFCNVKLPSVKPLAPSNAEIAKRLFLVCQPGLPPLYSLKDVFARFGGLIELYILPGKNCGYASYADANAADQAIKVLHGAELYGSRLKVMEADPPSSERRDGRKRQRMD